MLEIDSTCGFLFLTNLVEIMTLVLFGVGFSVMAILVYECGLPVWHFLLRITQTNNKKKKGFQMADTIDRHADGMWYQGDLPITIASNHAQPVKQGKFPQGKAIIREMLKALEFCCANNCEKKFWYKIDRLAPPFDMPEEKCKDCPVYLAIQKARRRK